MTSRFPFLVSLALLSGLLCAGQNNAQEKYSRKPTPKSVAWGYYDAKTPPVLRGTENDGIPLSRDRACKLASAAAGLRITELVDGDKGVHMMLPKSMFAGASTK